MARPLGSRNRPKPENHRAEDVNEVDEAAELEAGAESGGEESEESDESEGSVIPPTLPFALRFPQPYAYWTDDGQLRQWSAGSVEEDPDEIANLIGRGAPVEEVA